MVQHAEKLKSVQKLKLKAEKKRSRSLGTSSSSRIQDGWYNVVLLSGVDGWDYDDFRSISMEQGGLEGGYRVVSTAGFMAGEMGGAEGDTDEEDREMDRDLRDDVCVCVWKNWRRGKGGRRLRTKAQREKREIETIRERKEMNDRERD
ncbi:hypothetical protein ACFX1Z_031820 [Malus domestica]